MKKRSKEEVQKTLTEIDADVAAGMSISDACKKHHFNKSAYYYHRPQGDKKPRQKKQVAAVIHSFPIEKKSELIMVKGSPASIAELMKNLGE